MADYDVIVLGGGPGGYVAAIRCAQLGLKTACIDDRLDDQGRPSPGGVCLNVGCIPSKALLDSSHHFHRIQHELSAHGIRLEGKAGMDVATMQQRKRQVVATLTRGIALLFRKHGVEQLAGRGRLLPGHRVRFTPHEGDAGELEARHIIVATGSRPAVLPGIPFDGERIVDSTGALAFDEVPRRLAVIGGGVIALELGSVWSRLGAKVTLLERGERFLGHVEAQLAQAAHKALVGQGLDIRLGARVGAVKRTPRQVSITYADADGEHRLQADRLLVATGRVPNTEDIGAAEVGLRRDARGFIEVDEHCRTNLPGIHAIGDVVRGPMLAHKASEEGVMVAERIAGQLTEADYGHIPFVIYTAPEIAWVGRTSEQLEADGIDFRSGVFPLLANGRAHASGETAGMVKILADARTDRILGVHILGPGASELIGEAVTAMAFDAAAEDLARIVHAHPTLSEALHEAALAVDGRAIHV